MLIYDDAEQAYLRWVQAHPNGYVLNAAKGEGKLASVTLHRATCRSIGSNQHTNYTTTSYNKVCSLKKQELVDWGRKHSRSFKECSLCKP
ncbi:MAG: hypothetical protein U0703_14820 [Anaerolineae bacterium]